MPSESSPEGRSREVLGRGISAIDIILFLAGSAGLFFLEKYIEPPPIYEGFIGIIGAFLIVFVIMKMRGQSFADIGLRRPKRLIMLPLWIIAIYAGVIVVAGGGQLIANQFFETSTD